MAPSLNDKLGPPKGSTSPTSLKGKTKFGQRIGSLNASMSSVNNQTADHHTGFHVHITGCIESGQIANASRPLCKYQFASGPDWQKEKGFVDGETQSSENISKGELQPSVVWNFPIDIVYKSTNAFGWPRVVVAVSIFGPKMYSITLFQKVGFNFSYSFCFCRFVMSVEEL